jgi:hypothetical protein
MSEQSALTPRRGARGGIADSVWRRIMEYIDDRIDERMDEMATVVGREAAGDRGNVVVQLDSEDAPRQVGFARVKGQKYSAGDRVAVGKNRAGDRFVKGGIATGSSAGADRVVDNEHLITDAVDGRVIQSDAIARTHIAPQAVGYTEMDNSIANTIQSAPDKAFVNQGDADERQWVRDQGFADEAWVNANFVKFGANFLCGVMKRLNDLDGKGDFCGS